LAFLENLRTSVGNYFLTKEVTKSRHARTILNLKEAKSVGMIFSSDTQEDVELIKKYGKYLKDLGKKVEAIGYIKVKEPSVNHGWWSGVPYITRKEINWYYKPNENLIHNFVKEEFDLLLDLNINDEMPLKFVSASSKAKCKVGKYGEKYLDIYDVMIETDSTKNLKYFLQNVDTYMEMLNKGRNV
jgi:hypothetical protein